jgi:hypothetical protein
MDIYVSEEFKEITLFCEENIFGGIEIWCFSEFCSWVHVRVLRRGDHCVFLGEFNCVWVGFCGVLTRKRVICGLFLSLRCVKDELRCAYRMTYYTRYAQKEVS